MNYFVSIVLIHYFLSVQLLLCLSTDNNDKNNGNTTTITQYSNTSLRNESKSFPREKQILYSSQIQQDNVLGRYKRATNTSTTTTSATTTRTIRTRGTTTRAITKRAITTYNEILGCSIIQDQPPFGQFVVEANLMEFFEGFLKLNRKQRIDLNVIDPIMTLRSRVCSFFEVPVNMSNPGNRTKYEEIKQSAQGIFNIILRENYKTCKKEKSCKFCTGFDAFGNKWTACENETAAKNCPGVYEVESSNSEEYLGNGDLQYHDFATWYCPGGSSVFQGMTPDYSRCDTTIFDQFGDPNATWNADYAKMYLDHLKDITNVNQSDSTKAQYFGHEIRRRSQQAFNAVRLIEAKVNFTELKNLTNDGLTVIASLLTNKEQWKQLPKDERLVVATSVLNDLESTAIVLAKRRKNFKETVTPLNEAKGKNGPGIKIVVGSEVLKPLQDKTLSCSDKLVGHESSISVKIPANVLKTNGDGGKLVEFVGSIIQLEYVEDILQVPVISPIGNGTGRFTQDDSKRMNGKMISFNITGLQSFQFEEESVRIEFAHNVPAIGETKHTFRRKLHPGEIGKAVLGDAKCAFWDKTQLKWSTEGCRRIPSKSDIFSTTCACNHLTSFSVLMGFHEYAGKDRHLQMISWVLCPISMICLLMTVMIFCTLKNIRTEQTKITTNLCVTLILGNFLLLLGDKDNFYMSEATCTTFGVFGHYAWLCAFGWMAVEGIHLYQQVVKVFHSGRDDLLKLYSLGAYGIPVVIVGLTLTVGFAVEKKSIYSGELFCWLRGHYIWAFMIPVILVLLGNLAVLIKAVSIANSRRKDKMVQKAIQHEQQRKANKKLIKGTVSLSMLLGLTWSVGFFTMVEFTASNVLAYVFTILNASQGIFIFIFHCCMNKTIRTHLSKVISQRLPTITWSSPLSNSTEGSIQSKPKPQDTSESK